MFTKKNPNSFVFKTLGSQKFLSLLKIADTIIGNSSSGILEMPTFKKCTINIGNRQKGRVKSNSVINVLPNKFLIKKKIDFIFSKKIRNKNVINPYRKSNASKIIVSILKKINLDKYRNKKFYD